MAALVKGAQIPFDGWLLGAMVAPTPVSAILHSATMVKIAPWLLLQLSPALAGTATGLLLSTLGGLVFAAAAYLALSRSLFKEILGYSTISLLGLMIALAALGTPEAVTLTMVMILFHALSKALLFLGAGAVEKLHHRKDVEQMKGLVAYAPLSARFLLFGFVSLTLPPFGLFVVKLFAIEELARLLRSSPGLLPLLLAVLVGSTLLVLLYFKATAAILSRPSDLEVPVREKMPAGFAVPLWSLAFLVVWATLHLAFRQQVADLTLFFLPVAFLALAPLAFGWMRRFDRVKPYHCGEREPFDAALFYHMPGATVRRAIYGLFTLLFAAVALTGVLS
jgi:ech hydrogenase subunit A